MHHRVQRASHRQPQRRVEPSWRLDAPVASAQRSRRLHPALVLMTTALCLLPVVAVQAQRGTPPFEGPRGAFSFELSDGEPVSFYLEWSRMLELTEPQKESLIEIRRRLRVQNAPFMKQLDSLRELAGIDMTTRGRLTERDRESFERFQQWAAPVIESIRLNNDGARREIRGVLDARQAARADSVQADLRDGRFRRERRADRRERQPSPLVTPTARSPRAPRAARASTARLVSTA